MKFLLFFYTMEVNKLYKVWPQNYRGNTDPLAILLLTGDSVSVGVLGREVLPTTQASMINLLDVAALTTEGAHVFELLPRYICFSGTAVSIDLTNYDIEEIGAIS